METFRTTKPAVLELIKDDLVNTRVEWYEIQMNENPTSVFVGVTLDATKIIGHIALRIVSDYVSGQRYAWLDSLEHRVVKLEEKRHLKELLDLGIKWAKKLGVTEIRAIATSESMLFEKGISGAKLYAKIFTKEI
jgi:hypothetical protein